MILGRTRKGGKIGKGLSEDVRGLDLRDNGRHQRGAVTSLPADPQIAENEIGGIMKIGVANTHWNGMNLKKCQHHLHLLASLRSPSGLTNQRLRSK